jgi:hypothetical protein
MSKGALTLTAWKWPKVFPTAAVRWRTNSRTLKNERLKSRRIYQRQKSRMGALQHLSLRSAGIFSVPGVGFTMATKYLCGQFQAPINRISFDATSARNSIALASDNVLPQVTTMKRVPTEAAYSSGSMLSKRTAPTARLCSAISKVHPTQCVVSSHLMSRINCLPNASASASSDSSIAPSHSVSVGP